MATLRLHLLCLLFAASGVASNVTAADKALTIGGRTLSLAVQGDCSQAHRPGRELARYLAQYDPSGEPKADPMDETPLTQEEIRIARQALVESGFHYPDGQESVLTWMDFNGDGVCDFTASAGIGGMRPIDRMFLFQGVHGGGFRLAEAHLHYMDGAIVPVPYIALTVAGERLPLLARRYSLMQWQGKRKALAACENIERGAAINGAGASPVLVALCPHAREIYEWAARQLPHQNEISY
ncbi:hypothetical protein [Pseudoduganella lutea]|uniref:EF-hand domain-containing protein n=1 Tax=Pseudoduganella lutea TaxID=321985 RepID=A0A4P6KTM5_9BURK|nr:hypothetical protein [Pseudoduganella lutea]QBE62260.1 hypothetical protein EWM63_04060 [Pseudoduganella lutea]